MPVYRVRAAIGCAFVFLLLIAGQAKAQPVWHAHPELTASDPYTEQQFGYSVSIDGDTAIVGAVFDHEAGRRAGAAYVFVREGRDWVQQQKLTAEGVVGRDSFGFSVALSGDRAVIGAYQHDDQRGAAYVFLRTDGVWRQEAKLMADDAAPRDLFGAAVAISGGTVVVTAPWDGDRGQSTGAAYVFTLRGGMWVETQKLLGSDTAQHNSFGLAAAVDGDWMVITAPREDGRGRDSGAAYVFGHTDGGWSETQKITPVDIRARDEFGTSVSLSGDRAIVGSIGDSRGGAYVFTHAAGMWTQEFKFRPADPFDDGSLGAAVAICGDTAVVANTEGMMGRGVAHLYGRLDDEWVLQTDLSIPGGDAEDRFGFSASCSGDVVVLGAPTRDIMVPDTGSVMLFRRAEIDGVTCAEDRECLSDHCVDGVCCDTPCGGGEAGDCQACSVAAGAASNGVCGAVTEGTYCDDELACVVRSVCAAGICAPDAMRECDDDDPCTVDMCVEPDGCSNVMIAGCDEPPATMDSGVEAGPGTIGPAPESSGCGCAIVHREPASRSLAKGLAFIALILVGYRRRV